MTHDTEESFLAAYDASRYARPSVSVDVALLTVRDAALFTLLLQRERHPHRGAFALPGGFVGIDESLDEAAARALRDKAGVSDVFVEQLYTFGRPTRDPRTRVITVAYMALIDEARVRADHDGATLAKLGVPWEGETGGSVDAYVEHGDSFDERVELAFDHAEILGTAVKRIRGKLRYTPIGFQLLPERFTLRQLRRVHEAILGRPMNKDSFRRTMLASGDLEATGARSNGPGRPAELYRFQKRSAV